MELYARPMACSLASHITALEADLPVAVHFVDNATQRTDDGEDFLTIAPNGYVPALRLPTGTILNEGPSVLQWLADQKPGAGLAPMWGTPERYEVIDALNYLSTEVHKRIFSALFSPKSSDEAKSIARAQLDPTLSYLARRLGERDVLVGNTFTVADAYLVTLLNWFRHVGADLTRWPTLAAYHTRHLARPAVAKAISIEMAERKRRAA